MTTFTRQIRIISFLFFLFFAFPNNLPAQEYLDIESNNVRVDPDWTRTYEAGDFSWTYDVAVDKSGNIYSTGYFQKTLKIGKDVFNPGTKCYSRCPNTYFLMKHDNKGNFIWVQCGIGSSRPCKIAVDDKGFIYTVGNAYDKELYFTSSDSTKIKLNRPNYFSGIFICKYDENGKLLKTKFLSEKINETSNDFFIDNENNFYIGGDYEFRNYDKKYEARKSFLLLKLDENWELIWKQKGDTVGQSTITSICLDKSSNIYTTGNFISSIDFGSKKFVSHNQPPFQTNQNTFAAKFNDKGQLQWAIDSIGKFTLGSGKGIVCDKKGNVYVAANSGFSKIFFSKIDKDGKLQWYHTITGKSSIDNEKMLIDEDDNIYLCGEGYGAVFGSNNPVLFSFKSKGATDFYFAKYDTKGECLWLKAGGGKGTDYCKSIALYRNDLITFGWFGTELNFKDSVIKSNSGYTLWLAKFNLKKFESSDKKQEMQTTSKSDNSQEKFKINSTTCECFQVMEKQNALTPSLKTLVSYREFKEIIGWQCFGNEKSFNEIFFKNLQTTSSRDAAFYSLTAIAYKPIRLVNPDKSFGINLTPCTDEKNIFELPVDINYTHGIKKYIPDFEYKEFDHTAKSYLNVFINIAEIEEKELLEKVLFDYTEVDLKDFFSKVNQEYKTQIKLNDESPEESIKKIKEELQKKSINISDFVLNEFILSEKTIHKINDSEAERFEMIFSKWLGNFTIDDIDKGIIYPKINATFTAKNIGIDISENIIRKWDALKNKPATDKGEKFIPATILADASGVKYSNIDGFSASMNNICFTRSEITGTGILLSFSQAILTTAKYEYPHNLEFHNYPLFVLDSIFENSEPIYGYVYNYDTLLTNFSGLLIKSGTFNIPFKNKIITANGSNIILNNKLISGTILFRTYNLTDSKTIPAKIQIGADEKITIETTIEELEKYFKDSGLTDFKFDKEGGYLKMYFKKVLR